MNELIVLQMVLAAGLFYSCFCRMVRTDDDTIREIRLAIWFEAVAAGLVFGAPFLPLLVNQLDWPAGSTPEWVWVILLLATTLMQFVTSRYWRHQPPGPFQKG